MAVFPTFETTLLQIAKALGTTKSIGSTKKKNKFKTNEQSLDKFWNTWKEVLHNIFDALELAKEERDDLVANIQHAHDIHKYIELNVFTSKASKQKVVWHYLSRVLIPALARHSVFWQIQSKIDEGMPGGKFWYLPFIAPNDANAKVELPMQQVLNWLFDLIALPKGKLAKDLELELRIYEGLGTIQRNLDNWLKGKSTPEISSIKNTFPDDVSIEFRGVFKTSNTRCYFEQALELVQNKGHTANSFKYEINMSESDLKRIFDRNCSSEIKVEFTNKVNERYQQPTLKTIRQRLIIARALQEGYEQLVNYFTPNLDKYCSDLNKNKVLQLVRLYEMTYNHTLHAHNKCIHLGNIPDRELIENKLFTHSLLPIYRRDILLCVATEPYDTITLVAARLNEIYSEESKTKELNDVFIECTTKQRELHNSLIHSLENQRIFNSQFEEFHSRLKRNEDLGADFQSTEDFNLFLELNKYKYPQNNINQILTSRLAELENTPTQQLKRILQELELLLFHTKWENDTESNVNKLIREAKNNSEIEYFLPLLLRLEAYHQMAQNKLKEAEKTLKQAIEGCKKNSFGSLRGVLARQAFSLAIANQKLIPENHETYFRDMILWGGFNFEEEALSTDILALSRHLHELFWTKQYQHYPAYQPIFSEHKKDFKAFCDDFLILAKNGESVQPALVKHDHLKKKQLKSPQADSILLLLLKITYDTQLRNSRNKHNARLSNGINKMEALWQKNLSALRELIMEWPEIVDLSDFKNQTPLMLAVSNRDLTTARTLLDVGACADKQDINGRTALHFACASRSLECLKLLIERSADEYIINIEGSNALHTAVRVGDIGIVMYLTRKHPQLLSGKELGYRTPLILAEEISTNASIYAQLAKALKVENREVEDQSVYNEVYISLKNETQRVIHSIETN